MIELAASRRAYRPDRLLRGPHSTLTTPVGFDQMALSDIADSAVTSNTNGLTRRLRTARPSNI
jgi:hypothetical protein